MFSPDTEPNVMFVPQKPNVYSARIAGHNFLHGDYAESFAISWPCGRQTKLRSQTTLYEFGDAISEHMDECNQCEYYSSQKQANPNTSSS